MELIAKSLISLLGIGALCLVIYVQRDSLTAAKERAEAAEQITRDRDNIATTLTERENLIERLQHDDPAIRTWFDTPLPDAVARLREHPAVTGADADSQRLPSNHALPVAGSGTQD
ncbi:hypothetical protein [Collimonas humicola]|uniref:hypothetical protein n=1 Tax=Collimonas humicola TaxID=2825886 RepID=UPI001B8AF174|nr:hypothetical protein [Collimonas humicola]